LSNREAAMTFAHGDGRRIVLKSPAPFWVENRTVGKR